MGFDDPATFSDEQWIRILKLDRAQDLHRKERYTILRAAIRHFAGAVRSNFIRYAHWILAKQCLQEWALFLRIHRIKHLAAKNFFRKNGHWKDNMPSEDQHPLPSLKAAIAKIMRGRKDADQSYHQHCSALATPREDGTTLQEWAVTLFEAFERARCHDVFISKVLQWQTFKRQLADQPGICDDWKTLKAAPKKDKDGSPTSWPQITKDTPASDVDFGQVVDMLTRCDKVKEADMTNGRAFEFKYLAPATKAAILRYSARPMSRAILDKPKQGRERASTTTGNARSRSFEPRRNRSRSREQHSDARGRSRPPQYDADPPHGRHEKANQNQRKISLSPFGKLLWVRPGQGTPPTAPAFKGRKSIFFSTDSYRQMPHSPNGSSTGTYGNAEQQQKTHCWLAGGLRN